MKSRLTRPGLVASAIGLGVILPMSVMAGPAQADSYTVTSLPDSIKIKRTDVVYVNIPDSAVCGAGTFSARVAGRQDAVTLSGSAMCSGTTLMATVTPTSSKKRNATVKFRLVRTDGSSVVMTLVVHIKR